MTRPRHVPRELIDRALANLSRTSVILVGVADYNQLPSLHGPSFDLEMISDLLLENEDISLYRRTQVIELENPTSEQFRKAIINFVRGRSARGDILILYFTGHGCVLGASSFGFCLRDTRLGVDEKGVLPLSVVSLEDVLHTLSSYDVHPVFILDACFSSMTAPKGYSHVPDAVHSTIGMASAETYALIASSSSYSTSIDTLEGGAFTQTMYSIINAGLVGEAGRHSPFITLNDLASPLQEELSRQGLPISRCYIGRDLPLVPIARNIKFQPQTERFSPYMRQIIEYIWNNGSPRVITISELINAIGRGAYGNHSKLSLPPWDLLENGEASKTRRLTSRGKSFAQGRLRIPQVIVRNPSTWEWEAASDADHVRIHDVVRRGESRD